MNAVRPSPFGTEPYPSLQIFDELSKNDSLTQRYLCSKLGIALILVYSYIKSLMQKGLITVKTIPPRRHAYDMKLHALLKKPGLLIIFSLISHGSAETRKNLTLSAANGMWWSCNP